MLTAKRLLFLLLPFLLAITACENPYVNKGEETEVLNVSNKLTIFVPEQENFSYTHLCFALYDETGKRLRQNNQTNDDEKFGSTTFKLDEGQYQLVVLAHSCTRNPAMTNPEKIQFSNSQGYTETFLFYDLIEKTETQQTVTASLKRVVAMARFVIEDSIPEGLTRLKCQYTGGSGHLNAITGHGVMQSMQQAEFSLQPKTTNNYYDLYTFLPEEVDSISLIVSAFSNDNNKLLERTFSLPMQSNHITWLTGKFFTTPASDEWTIMPKMSIEPLWDGETVMSY